MSKTQTCYRYNDIKAMGKIELNNLCSKYSIESKLSKSAKIVILCDALKISTTGGSQTEVVTKLNSMLTKRELKEYSRFTPYSTYSLTTWSRNIKMLPLIDDTSVKEYLMNTVSYKLSENDLRRYKLTRPFLLQNGIHSGKLTETKYFTLIQGQCNPSQSTCEDNVKWCYAIIDKVTGTPYGGFCTCTAGESQTCGHIGALLFQVAECVAQGLEQFPEEVSCTEKPCSWIEPKGAKVPPLPLAEFDLNCTDTARLKRTPGNYQPLPKTITDVKSRRDDRFESAMKLQSDLYLASIGHGFVPPIVKIIDHNKFRGDRPIPSTPPQMKSLPDVCTDAFLPIQSEVTVESLAVQITELPHLTFKSGTDNGFVEERKTFIDSVYDMSSEKAEKVEVATRGQWKNPKWKDQKMGAIGSVKAHSVVRKVNNGRTGPDNLVRSIVYGSQSFKSKSVLWGLNNESRARNQYKKILKESHDSMNIHETGLIIDVDHPYLRVSPDGIIQCQCHDRKLLEIKCPMSKRMLNPNIDNTIPYIE